MAAAAGPGQLTQTAAKMLGRRQLISRSETGVVGAGRQGGDVSASSPSGRGFEDRGRSGAAEAGFAAHPGRQAAAAGSTRMEIVTGTKQFAMDLEVPGALPTMFCRPPTINAPRCRSRTWRTSRRCPGSPTWRSSLTRSSFPAASRSAAQTFGQCIDAIDALKVVWGPGTVDGKSDQNVLADLHAAELPI